MKKTQLQKSHATVPLRMSLQSEVLKPEAQSFGKPIVLIPHLSFFLISEKNVINFIFDSPLSPIPHVGRKERR